MYVCCFLRLLCVCECLCHFPLRAFFVSVSVFASVPLPYIKFVLDKLYLRELSTVEWARLLEMQGVCVCGSPNRCTRF